MRRTMVISSRVMQRKSTQATRTRAASERKRAHELGLLATRRRLAEVERQAEATIRMSYQVQARYEQSVRFQQPLSAVAYTEWKRDHKWRTTLGVGVKTRPLDNGNDPSKPRGYDVGSSAMTRLAVHRALTPLGPLEFKHSYEEGDVQTTLRDAAAFAIPKGLAFFSCAHVR